MTGALRVLVLAPHFPPEAGAAAARLSSFARGLAALGHDVRVVAPQPSYLLPAGARLDDAANVRRVSVRARGRGALGNALHQARLALALRRGAREALAEGEADVVLVSTPPPVAALAGLGLRRRDGRALPVALDVRDLWPDVLVEAGLLAPRGLAARVLALVARRLESRATVLVAATSTKAERLAIRAPGRPVQVVANGVEEEWTAPAPAYRGGGSEGDFTIVHAGNIGRAQDVALLVRAVASEGARGARPLAALLVGDGEERERALALGRELGAPVAWRPPVPRAQVLELLADCGCAFVTLRTKDMIDAVPSKLLDAMARGVPVVLAAAGESARVLEESGGGVVTPPGDVAALAGALRGMASLSPEERVALGARGRAHVLARFRREDAARELAGALARAAKGAS